jgi:putative toxin-antitoxin system antitoxin component (TIGR02293 family)
MTQPNPNSPEPAFSAWARDVNRLASQAGVAEPPARYHVRGKAHPTASARPLLTHDEAAGGFGWRMAHDVAEALVERGLDPDYLAALATSSGLEPRDLFEFAGIDRTTIARRKAAGATLPHEAAVKALQATELLAQATEVFGSADQAAVWLTRPHPVLDGQTPLRRARTPWGLGKVQGMLAALRYGGVA